MSWRWQAAERLAGSIGIGAAAGIAAAACVMFGRKAVTTAKIGKGHPLKHRVFDLAAGAVQHKYPLDAMSTYLSAFHIYADDMGRQVEATHFCTHLRHDLHQCVIFDTNGKNARILGVEYIISDAAYQKLPDEEKKYYHPHRYEIIGGLLIAPGMPAGAEKEFMEKKRKAAEARARETSVLAEL